MANRRRRGVDPRYASAKFSYKISAHLITEGESILTKDEISLPRLVGLEVARQLADAAVDQLHSGDVFKRPQASTGRLEKAIRDSRNVEVGDSYIRMFLRPFLSSQVPYWDAIDRGTNWFVEQGFILYGHWLDRGEPGPFRNRSQEGVFVSTRAPKGLNPYRYGVNTPAAGRRSSRILTAAGFSDRQRFKTSGRIKNKIEAHHYVDAAREAFRGKVADQVASSILRGLGGKG